MSRSCIVAFALLAALSGCGGEEHPLVSRDRATHVGAIGVSPAITLVEAVNAGNAWQRGSRVDAWLVGSCCAVTTAPAAVGRSMDECPASLVLQDTDAQGPRASSISDDDVLWTCRIDPQFLLAVMSRPPIGTPGSALATMAPTPGTAVTLRDRTRDAPAVVDDVRTERFTVRILTDGPPTVAAAASLSGTIVVLSATGTLAGVVEHMDVSAGIATAVSAATLARLIAACDHTPRHAECIPTRSLPRQAWSLLSDWRPWLALAAVAILVLFVLRPRRLARSRAK